MNPYPSPSSITMQRGGEKPVTITLEDAVVIMTNQQKTIEELIANNQRMFQYIQEAQKTGGFGNIQFAQQNLSDPASHVYGNGGASQQPVREKPMTLNEYLAMKKNSSDTSATAATASNAPAPAAAAPMTLSEFLALKKSKASETSTTATNEEDVPVFNIPSKTEPVSTDL